MSNRQHPLNQTSNSSAPLANALIASVRAEELILERLITAVSKGDSEGILAASADLAAHRLGTKAENCAA